MWPGRLRSPAVALGAALVAACAGHTAPLGFLPTPQEAQSSAYGGWIELTLNGEERVEGELLAVNADSVWVLSSEGGAVVPTAAVVQGKLTRYAWSSGNVTTWTAVGVLSTISNGLVLIFTAPVWVITGSVAGAGESHAAQRLWPRFAWAALAEFARFPQGMPPDLSWQNLRPKQE